MAEKSSGSVIPAGLAKNKWVAALLALIVGLGLGTSLGREVLDTAGIPESCVEALQRADKALDTGTAVADNGKEALAAVKALELGEAADLLSEAKGDAQALVALVLRFNEARTACNDDRK